MILTWRRLLGQCNRIILQISEGVDLPVFTSDSSCPRFSTGTKPTAVLLEDLVYKLLAPKSNTISQVTNATMKKISDWKLTTIKKYFFRTVHEVIVCSTPFLVCHALIEKKNSVLLGPPPFYVGRPHCGQN